MISCFPHLGIIFLQRRRTPWRAPWRSIICHGGTACWVQLLTFGDGTPAATCELWQKPARNGAPAILEDLWALRISELPISYAVQWVLLQFQIAWERLQKRIQVNPEVPVIRLAAIHLEATSRIPALKSLGARRCSQSKSLTADLGVKVEAASSPKNWDPFKNQFIIVHPF